MLVTQLAAEVESERTMVAKAVEFLMMTGLSFRIMSDVWYELLDMRMI